MTQKDRRRACHNMVWWRDIQIPEIEFCALPPGSEPVENDDWMLLSIAQGHDGDEVGH